MKRLAVLLSLSFLLIFSVGTAISQQECVDCHKSQGIEISSEAVTEKDFLEKSLFGVFISTPLPEIIFGIENFYVKPEIDREKFLKGIIKGALESLDPYSRYVSPEEIKEDMEEMSGRYYGIGLKFLKKDFSFVVVEVFEGAPAEKAGLMVDDIIIKVNGESVQNLSSEEIIRKIRGPISTNVSITVLRKDHPEPITFTVCREKIKIPNVIARRIDNILYLKLTEFNLEAPEDLLKAIEEYQQKAKNPKMILDLRNNPGGNLNVVLQITGLFLKKNQIIVVTKDRFERKIIYRSNENMQYYDVNEDGRYSEIPLVLLVNHFSASGSELLASCLQENGRAKLVGIKTFGKGCVQTQINLKNGGFLYLTTQEFYSPKENPINGLGVVPDYEIHLEAGEKIGDSQKDSQLRKALEILK